MPAAPPEQDGTEPTGEAQKHSPLLVRYVMHSTKQSQFQRQESSRLAQMRRIYTRATEVLVLDSWLFGSDARDKNHEEILLKIFSWIWNTRLWTYQEGALARSLYFQFIDVAYNLAAGVREIARNASPVANLTIVQALRVRYHTLRSFRHHETIEAKLGAVRGALSCRRTSVSTDEALCVAVLLDLNVADIARTEPSLRIQAFWEMLPRIPERVIFGQTARFDIDGLRWAPRTLLGTPSDYPQQSFDSFDHTDRGVAMHCSGIRFFCEDYTFN
ncbi:hypothetical protein F4861DRAFT_330806 [Xylaria intraflava]|nr:hypothetical protein F4861DRAFT_330806 [Xylaria intraflava]